MTKEERRRLKASIRRGARYQTPQEIEEKMFQDKLEKIANEFDITPDQVYEELVIKKS